MVKPDKSYRYRRPGYDATVLVELPQIAAGGEKDMSAKKLPWLIASALVVAPVAANAQAVTYDFTGTVTSTGFAYDLTDDLARYRIVSDGDLYLFSPGESSRLNRGFLFRDNYWVAHF